MFEELLNFARNPREEERIRALINYLITSDKPNIVVYRNIILVRNSFVICNENVAKFLLKHFTNGVVERADKRVNLMTINRRVESDKKYFENVRRAFEGTGFDVVLTPINDVPKRLYKWFARVKVHEFSVESYKVTGGSDEVILTLVSTREYRDEYAGVLDIILRTYFRMSSYEIVELRYDAMTRVTPYTRLIIDPEMRKIIVTAMRRDVK